MTLYGNQFIMCTLSRECLERALEIYDQCYQHHHPSVAIALTNLGAVMRSLGESERSKQLFEQALNIEEQLYEPNHPSVSHVIHASNSILPLWRLVPGCHELYAVFLAEAVLLVNYNLECPQPYVCCPLFKHSDCIYPQPAECGLQ